MCHYENIKVIMREKGVKAQRFANRRMKCKPDPSAWQGVELAKIYDRVSEEKERADKAMLENELYQQKCKELEEELRQIKLEKEREKDDSEKLRENLDKTRIELKEIESKLQNVTEQVNLLKIDKSNLEIQTQILTANGKELDDENKTFLYLTFNMNNS